MITSLQIILAAVGVLFVALVVGYNLWQERKYRKEASRLFSSRREDILLGESVVTENQDDITAPDDVGRDDGAGWRLQQATRQEWNEDEVAEPERAEPAPERTEPEPMPIRVEEGPIREAEEDLRVPTHAEALVAAQARAFRPATAAVPQPVVEPEAPPPPRPVAERPAAEHGATEARPAAERPTAETQSTESRRFQAESGLDQGIEYLARLRFAQPVPAAYAGLLDGLRRLGKPIRVMGKRHNNSWEPVNAHTTGNFDALEFGILLADRSGALDSDQLERFCRVLYDYAAARGGAVSSPDKQAALQQARDLDLFCMDVDMLIGLNVVSRDQQPFKAADLHLVMADEGMAVGRDGVYYLKDPAGHTLFSLTNQESQPFKEGGSDFVTHGVTLLFDVPRVANGIEVFDRMTRLGQRLAEALGGRLVDDNGRPVSQDSLQKDRRRLSDYYGRMQERGIPAGGERALRLFA